MDKLFINYSGNIESFKRLGLEETYKKCIVFIEKGGAIYTHNTYYAGPDIIKSIQEALGELQAEIKEGDYVSSIKQVDGKIEATMGTFEGRDSKILEDSMSYTDELKRDATKAITTEYIRATGVEKSLSERIDSHLDITERALSEKADKDSVYDKNQIDLKLTGVYKIKGSCTFEELPETNKVGDVYNITNSFTLDEEEYTAGTNIVYTENGWDVLAGIFDTSAIELDIQRVSNLLALEAVRAIKAENDLEDKINEGAARALEKELELDKKFDDYLPLSGGTLTKSLDTSIIVFNNEAGMPYINFKYKKEKVGEVGVTLDKQLVFNNTSKWNNILHEGNYSDYALPLTGGTINGRLQINRSDDSHTLILNTEKDSPAIAFKSGDDTITRLVADKTSKYLCRTNIDWSEQYRIWDSGNFNPSDYLPLSGGIINAKEKSPLKITGGNYGEISIGVFKDGNEMSVFGYAETQGTFMWDNVSHSRLYLRNNKLFFTSSANAAAETIWHSGNDGSGSGLDADTLDGKHLNKVFTNYGWGSVSGVNSANSAGTGLYFFGGSGEDMPFSHGVLVSFLSEESDQYRGMQLHHGNNLLHYRSHWDNSYSDWKQIAFTDYNGFYSLNTGVEILADSDLNDYKTVGTYFIHNDSIAKTIKNVPLKQAGKIVNQRVNGATSHIILTYLIDNGIKEYSRLYNVSGWSNWVITKENLNNYNAPTATKATQDSEGNVITDTYALKSDLIIGLNITDGVYAVKADGSLCTIDEADTSCTGVALIAGEHKFMMAKRDATNDGSNYNLNWEYTLTDTSLPNHPYVYNTSYEEGYLPNANGEYTSTPNLPNDYTLWNYGSLSEFDGKSNTAIVSNISNNSKDIFTVLKTFNQEEQASGRSADWYVPALGQLALIYLNITNINSILTKIGGTTLRNNSYWSSTEHSANFAWIVNFSNGYVYISRKVHYGYVSARFIKNIQVEPPKSVKESITEIKDQLKQPAESALKLATPVKLWGNDFDGSSSISESLNIDNNSAINFKDTKGNNVNSIGVNSYNLLAFGYGTTLHGYDSLFFGKTLRFSNSNDAPSTMIIDSKSNVGIGTTDPLYKLDVDGVINAKTVIGGNNTGYYLKDKNGDNVRTLCITTENALLLGHDTASLNYATVIDGSMIALRCNTTHSNALIINPSGNVTIGKSDLASTNYKLYVDGLLHTNSLSIQSDTKVDNLNADKLDGYEAEDFALKSDVEVEVEVEVPNGVYAVTAYGTLIDYNSADATATGVALVAGKHRFMIAKSDATDGTNTTLYWGKKLYGKDVAGVVTNNKADSTNSYGYLPKPDGTFSGSKHLSDDFTTWTAGALAEFNGAANIAAIINGYTEHGVSMDARDMCTVLNTFNASDSFKDWYVPACGQLALMYLNMTEINAALAKIGGTALAAGGYWSSSENSSDNAWYVRFSEGRVDNGGSKDGSYRVRFIRDLTIKKPLKERISELESKISALELQILEILTQIL